MQSPKFFCKYCKKFISVLENEITKNHLQFLNKIPSSLLESYELEYNIGIGTLGIVYKAINTIDDKTFALKLISFLESELTQEQTNQNIQDFIKEIKILSNVKHENILNYITSIKFSEDNMIALIMELAETNLSNIITSLTPVEMMDSVIQICIGLDYLHNEKHISHGNLKLENLLILNKKIKISDFCFAKVKHYEKERNRRIFEKQYYMAPELLNDEDFLDNKIDIWSLGIIIHKIFTGGVHPFGSTKITSNIRNGNYYIDKRIQNDKIIEIIQGCFKKNPNERIDIKKILEILIVQTPKEIFVNKNSLPKNPIELNSINPQGKSINVGKNLSNQILLGNNEKEIKEKNSNTSKITPIFDNLNVFLNKRENKDYKQVEIINEPLKFDLTFQQPQCQNVSSNFFVGKDEKGINENNSSILKVNYELENYNKSSLSSDSKNLIIKEEIIEKYLENEDIHPEENIKEKSESVLKFQSKDLSILKCPVCEFDYEKTKGCNLIRCESKKCSKKTIFCAVCGEKLKETEKLSHFNNNNDFNDCKNIVKKNNSSQNHEGKKENFEGSLEYSNINCIFCQNKLKKSLEIMEVNNKLVQCHSEKCKGKIFCKLCLKEVLENYIIDHIQIDCLKDNNQNNNDVHSSNELFKKGNETFKENEFGKIKSQSSDSELSENKKDKTKKTKNQKNQKKNKNKNKKKI